MKTDAVRILERLAIPHTIRRFHATDLSAEEAARALDVPLDRVVKTLVVRGDHTGVMRVLLPGTKRLSLKKLAHASGNKTVEFVPTEDLLRLTGYRRGGVSPLGGRRAHPVYCDISVLALPRILVNGGLRGLQLDVEPRPLIRAAAAVTADLSETT
jgi:Cys-tRNA(Pro)/Cys-tRNA(Cys) deacylase